MKKAEDKTDAFPVDRRRPESGEAMQDIVARLIGRVEDLEKRLDTLKDEESRR